MISPYYTYVGLGCFYSQKAEYYNTTCGEFCSGSSLNETKGKSQSGIIQTIEVEKSSVSGAKISGTTSVTVNSSKALSLVANLSYQTYVASTKQPVRLLGNVTWTSSNEGIATVTVSSGNTETPQKTSLSKVTGKRKYLLIN